MYRFEIWAPQARKMAVKVNDTALRMQGPDEPVSYTHLCWETSMGTY